MANTRKSTAVAKSASARPSTVKLPEGIAATLSPDGLEETITIFSGSEQNMFKPLGGSESQDFNNILLRGVLGCMSLTPVKNDPEMVARATAAAAAALRAFKPTDEVEGMLAAQAVALHLATMECFRRVALAGQPAEVVSKLRKDGVNLARGMTDMLGALDRKRGKGPQVVRVERVVVHEGGQAIVGNVRSGEGGGEA